jgi:hypothetical protein
MRSALRLDILMLYKLSADKINQLFRRSVLFSTNSALPRLTCFSNTVSHTTRTFLTDVTILSFFTPVPISPFRSRKTATMDESSEKSEDGPETKQKHIARPLRYRTGALWLLGIYISLIIIPWVLTCVLAHRPINSSSYDVNKASLTMMFRICANGKSDLMY